MPSPRRQTLPGTSFAAFLARATVAQAGFARLADVTSRQLINWCRSLTTAGYWASVLILVLADISAGELHVRISKVAVAQLTEAPAG